MWLKRLQKLLPYTSENCLRIDSTTEPARDHISSEISSLNEENSASKASELFVFEVNSFASISTFLVGFISFSGSEVVRYPTLCKI